MRCNLIWQSNKIHLISWLTSACKVKQNFDKFKAKNQLSPYFFKEYLLRKFTYFHLVHLIIFICIFDKVLTKAFIISGRALKLLWRNTFLICLLMP